jgi:protein-S-isoprenylcysteine O-methyltransferase Ste14
LHRLINNEIFSEYIASTCSDLKILIINKMVLKISSLIGFGIAVLGLFFLVYNNYIISTNPIAITIQIGAVALMVWARITFKFRSFHATANTTSGKLVTNGPYRWFRHPIYAAAIYFTWASVIAYPRWETFFASILVSGGMFLRMILEEKSLLATYEEYEAYSKRTKRIMPYVF